MAIGNHDRAFREEANHAVDRVCIFDRHEPVFDAGRVARDRSRARVEAGGEKLVQRPLWIFVEQEYTR